ncbi:MAG: hypothetical protein ACLFN8_03185 [Candidatus Woesearchaeota archaeon]
MKKKTKKAQLEVSFNWVFVLIAGAAILFFFLRVINTEIDTTDRFTETRATARMNTILTTIGQSPDMVNTNYNLNYEINFECTIEGHTYGIRQTNQQIPTQIVYSPKTIGNSKLIYWTQIINAPYPVDTALYLTDENTKYVFLKSNTPESNIQHYYNLFPEELSKEFIEIQDFKTRGDEDYRQYILITTDENVAEGWFDFSEHRQIAQKINYVIQIKETPNKILFRELKPGFAALQTESDSEQREYFLEEDVIGAIITGNPQLYDCARDNALNQIRIATDINLDRIKLIQQEYEESSNCYNRFGIATQNYFKAMSNATQTKDYDELKDKYSDIKSLNELLIQTSCITIY